MATPLFAAGQTLQTWDGFKWLVQRVIQDGDIYYDVLRVDNNTAWRLPESALVSARAVIISGPPTPTPPPIVYTGLVNIYFQPEETSILWDGAPVGNHLVIHPLPGTHTWQGSATGYYTATGSMIIEALKTYDLLIELAPLASGGTSWPWPMSVVQSWFEGLYNDILSWIHSSVGWVYDKISPLIDTLTHWVTSEVGRIWGYLSAQVAKVTSFVVDLTLAIPGWIRDEVIKVWDWLYAVGGVIITNVSGMFPQVWGWIKSASDVIISQVSGMFPQVWSWLYTATGIITSAVSTAFSSVVSGLKDMADFVGSKVLAVTDWFSNEFIDPFIDWLVQLPTKLWNEFLDTSKSIGNSLYSWFKDHIPAAVGWLKTNIPKALDWWISNSAKWLTTPLVWEANIASYMLDKISNALEPAFDNMLTMFEKMGPIAPDSGRPLLSAVIVTGGVLVAGLAAMTLAGETLQPLKEMGFGNIAAMIYDLMNYKVLTAAFVGVLAAVYIRTPLTYYYNRVARPNLPNDRSLAAMLEDRAITSEQYRHTMAWHGYPDIWIERIEKALYRPMTPYMLRSLAEAGLLDEDLLEHALNHAGYDDQAKVAIKQMMHILAAGTLATVSTGTAMSRYQEGFDDEISLRQNLSVLGVANSMLDRYVFAGNLKQYYDYQTDLRAYYIDSYHRRDIEEPELRTSLATIGIDTKRIQLIVAAQRIKRLAAPKPAADASISVQLDTIRSRRKKQLITREQEISQLVAIGEELPYATALADSDDVALTPAKAVIFPVVVLDYETDEGKTKVDTIRRLTRSGQLTSTDEIAALLELQMPRGLAEAIADNDLVRIKKSVTG
jgi:hypothetical protein